MLTIYTHEGLFEVPGNIPAGNYRMRVMYIANNYTIIPCETSGSHYGEVEDYTFTVLHIDCPAPSQVSVTNLTRETATINWSSTGNSFDIEWGLAGFELGTGTQGTATSHNFQLNELIAGITYDFYIRQKDCAASSGIYSNWKKFTFTTTNYCVDYPVYQSNPYINNFKTIHGQTNIYNVGTMFSNRAYGNFSGTHIASVVSGDEVSYEITTSVNSSQIVLVWVDWNNDGFLNNTNELINYFSGPKNIHSGSFVIPSNTQAGNYRMRIMLLVNTLPNINFTLLASTCDVHFGGETEDYTLKVLAPNSCERPTAVTVSSESLNSLSVSWTGVGTSFDVEYGVAGFALGTGTQVSTNEPSYVITNYNPTLKYDFYVRQNCSGNSNGKSYWKLFKLNNYCLPDTHENNIYVNYYIKNFSTTNGFTNISNLNSGLSSNGYGNYASSYVSQHQGENINFSISSSTETSKRYKVWVDWNNDGVFTDNSSEMMLLSPYGISEQTYNGSFTVPANQPTGFYRMRVMHFENFSNEANPTIDACLAQFLGEVEDYTVEVIEKSCKAVTNFSTSNLTRESATVNWTSTGSLFEIEWGYAGFTQGTGTQSTTIQTSYDLTGLFGGISYDIYVRQDCNSSSDANSYWRKFTFTTSNYCIPVQLPTSIYYGQEIHIKSFTTSGGITNIANTNSGYSFNGYGNFSSTHSAKQYASESLSFSLVPKSTYYGTGLKIWIDWNNDGVFSNNSSEIVYTSEYNFYGTHNGSFIIPSNKPVGNYRMRIMMGLQSANMTPCQVLNESSFYGEAEDYTLTIVGQTNTCATTTTWNGTSWSNGLPNATKKVIIEGNLNLTNDLTACEMLLNSGIVTVNSGVVLTVNGQIVNTQNETNFIVQNDANLIQVDDVENTGAITVKRNAVIKHLDYTTWSSPVIDQKLKAFSPYTLNNRIRIYDAVANTWKIVENPETTNFASGAGYMFRAPNVNDDGFYPNAYTWTGNFKGIPQNGNVTYNFSNATGAGIFQSLGNPYPSNINRANFHSVNPQIGTLYFWTNTNAAVNGVFVGNNYATINRAGEAVLVTSTQGGQNSLTPNDYIAVGQGFVAQTNGVINQAVFTNSMRTSENALFLRSSLEKHRFWLNLSKGTQEYNQMLVSYNEEATNEIDFGIDSELFGYTGSALYSLINQNDNKYIIQGRALPFTYIDVVPLGFKATEAGIYKVSLSDFDGIFAENQNIYIKDHQTSTQHNLKLSSYEFASLEGTFDDRFEIVYTDSVLDVSNPEYQNTWIVYKQNDFFHIQTQGFEMKEVIIYDMLGRIVYAAKADGNNHQINGLDTNGVYIVKIITNNNTVLNKKVQ